MDSRLRGNDKEWLNKAILFLLKNENSIFVVK